MPMPPPNLRAARLFGLQCRHVVICCAVAACSHSDAFTPHDASSTQPFVAGAPARLTYNPGADVTPAWLPDGNAFIYAYGTGGRDADVCLGVMGAAGGTLRRAICNHASYSGDSTDAFTSPALSPGGALAYQRSAQRIGAAGLPAATLGTAPLDAPDAFTVVQAFPFTSAGAFYAAAASVRWAGARRLVYVGEFDTDFRACDSCDFEAIRIGRDVLVSELDAESPGGVALAGTAVATSVSGGETDDEIYYTRANSTRIVKRSLATGIESIAYDFGSTGIVRDVHAAGGRLAAIVGGRVDVYFNGAMPVQRDRGGRLFVVDLSSASAHELSAPVRLFRHPALSPDGRQVLAEGFAISILVVGTRTDTTVAPTGDIFRFDDP